MTNNQINETLRLRIELAKSKAYLDIYDVSILSGFSISTLRKRKLSERQINTEINQLFTAIEEHKVSPEDQDTIDDFFRK